MLIRVLRMRGAARRATVLALSQMTGPRRYGTHKHAKGLGDPHYDCARQALTKIATMKASTPVGLHAKARILPMVIDDSSGSMEKVDEAFYRSFAADVRAFLDPLINADSLAANEPERQAA